jgi:TolB-like protein
MILLVFGPDEWPEAFFNNIGGERTSLPWSLPSAVISLYRDGDAFRRGKHRMTDIFISYARSTATQANAVAEGLRSAGYDVWRDDQLPAHRAYAEVIEEQLRSARAVIVLWSEDAARSQWVRAEADLARNLGNLVQVTFGPVLPPLPFNQIQCADLSDWTGAQEHPNWRIVLGSVAALVGAGPRPAAQAVRALTPAPAKQTGETILAVLPFENLSNDPELLYFSDGVSEDILGRISKGSRLKVIGRTSSFQFRGADKARAASALGATHVVDGSVRRAGAKVRITAELTEAAGGAAIWSERFDRDLVDIFAVQDEISEAVATALDQAFSPSPQTSMDPLIYDLYLRIRDWQHDPAKISENITALQRVVASAPAFSEGWGRLAVLIGSKRLTLPYAERGPWEALMRDCISKCVKLDPTNIEAGIARFHLLPAFGQFPAQQDAADWLLAHGGNTPYALNVPVFHLGSVGRNRESLAVAETARRLDPMNPVIRSLHAIAIWRAGRIEEGRAAMAETLTLWPDDHHTAAAMITAAVCAGDWATVDRLIDPDRLEQFPLREYTLVLGLVAILRSDSPDTHRILLSILQNRIETTGHLDPMSLIWSAQAGLAKETYDLVEQARFGPSGGPADVLGFNAYRTMMLFSAPFTPLRADPRFVVMCSRLGLVDYWLSTGVWPDCVDDTPYDFRAACLAARDAPRDMMP